MKIVSTQIILRKMYWMLGRNSKLSLTNKLLLYKSIIKPIWTYGIQLWGTAAASNIAMIQRFQSKLLRIITDAPWYVTNNRLHHDLELMTVSEEATKAARRYNTRLQQHPNTLATHLMRNKHINRLRRNEPQDLL